MNRIINATALAFAAPVAAWSQSYTIQALSPPVSTGSSFGLGINNAGVVVGDGSTASGRRALRWNASTASVLGVLPGFTVSMAYDISNDDRVVGRSGGGCAASDPMFWDAAGILDAGADPANLTVYIYSMNDHGMAVGEAFNSCVRPWVDSAHLWQYDAGDDVWAISTLPPFGSDPEASANDINNFGVAVGFSGDSGTGILRAVQWVGGVTSLVPDLGGGHSIAIGINDSGQVAGYSRTPAGDYHGYFFDGTSVNEIGTLPGYAYSTTYDVNKNGAVVGWSFNGSVEDTILPYLPPVDTRAFLWRNGQLHDAMSLIPAGTGWTSIQAFRQINDRGQITGSGVFGGRTRAFRMTPICMTRGDLNDDRMIDLVDLTLLLSDFGCTGFVCPGDITGDGAVDLTDLATQLANFGTSCD